LKERDVHGDPHGIPAHCDEGGGKEVHNVKSDAKYRPQRGGKGMRGNSHGVVEGNEFTAKPGS